MARLQKQRAQQMSVDHMFSGYRAAEVAANKARMEAARQEFSVEEHLRQLEQQELRHASGAAPEEEKSDDEQPSELDPAVSMFRVRGWRAQAVCVRSVLRFCSLVVAPFCRSCHPSSRTDEWCATRSAGPMLC